MKNISCLKFPFYDYVGEISRLILFRAQLDLFSKIFHNKTFTRKKEIMIKTTLIFVK